MKSIAVIVQTIGLGWAVIAVSKIVYLIRRALVEAAIKSRRNYNRKQGLPLDSGVSAVDSSSLSYQTDSVSGVAAGISLFVIGVLILLIIPLQTLQTNVLFIAASAIISIMCGVSCWLLRESGTERFKAYVYVSLGTSVILTVHIIVSAAMNRVLLFHFCNGLDILVYIWTALLTYRLIIGRKR